MGSAFEGIRVVDCSQGIAGPLACMLLADLGADVIKVEPPGGDRMAAHPGYLCWNRGKRWLSLDLGDAGDRAGCQRLVDSADVLLVEQADEALRPWGLDSESCRARNPALLHACLAHWGDAPGFWQRLPPDETLLWAMSGGALGQFSWEDVPVHLVTPQLGYAQGMLGAAALAASLYERARSGQGQQLMVSGLHAAAALHGGAAHRALSPLGSRAVGTRGTAPNYKLYRCADGAWLFLATLLMHHFERALRVIGMYDAIMAMEGVDGRPRNCLKRGVGGRVRRALEARFAERDRDSWLQLLGEHDVPAGPVGTREAWFASETVAANDMRLTFEHPRLGPVDMPGAPLQLGRTPAHVRGLPAPTSLEVVLAERARPKALEARPAPAGAGPLQGVTILDLGTVIAAPFGMSILGSFGANVIKIETEAGDPFRGGQGFAVYNRGKRGVVLDLKQPKEREALYELVRRADVVCDNNRVGVAERLGIDYPRLERIHPGIISASVSGFGQQGPLCKHPGFDPLVQALSGLMAAQGGDDEPVFHTVPVNDTASGMMIAFGVAAALYARARDGRGQRVHTSLASQGVLVQSGELTHFAGRPPNPAGGRDCLGFSPVRRFYRCGDDTWIAIACDTEAQVERLCKALGVEQPLAAPGAILGQPTHGPAAQALSASIERQPRQQVLEALLGAQVPAAPALRHDEMLGSELHQASGYFDIVEDHPSFGRHSTIAGYARWSRTPGGLRGREPGLGEHTDEVLREAGVR